VPVSEHAPTGYTISDYLLERLVELGVGHVFGVPGDYTLSFLDHVIAQPGLSWIGCTNELNAGYAADGYGRMRGIAALTTTFGVGELSAINASAGSFAEHVPVVHIVGAPSSGTQAANRIVHHSLGDGVFSYFLEMHSEITCARAALSASNALTEIDRVLVAVRDERLPGYLLLPADVGELPALPPRQRLAPPVPTTDPVALDGFIHAATRLMSTADTVAGVSVLAGVLAHRVGAAGALTDLLAAGPVRYATSLWGKSVVGEDSPRYVGIYAGAASEPPARAAVESATVLIVAGVQFTDLNSGFFTHQLDRTRTVELGAAVASVGAASFAPVAMADALRELAIIVRAHHGGAQAAPPTPTRVPTPSPRAVPETELTQQLLWPTVAACLEPGDIVLADQGTSFYGMATHRLPEGVTFIGQPLWASIGYTLPALLGACLATGRRGVLLIGDGAAQMTVQELSTILRLGLSPLIILVDNDGYTVERAIHGPDEIYNDIARWDWTTLPAVFAPQRRSRTARVTTLGQLRAGLAAAADSPDALTLLQAVVPRLDVPDLLSSIARAAGGANRVAQPDSTAS
jgi:TPP-dependent 2-oxoacid decarboxylase